MVKKHQLDGGLNKVEDLNLALSGGLLWNVRLPAEDRATIL